MEIKINEASPFIFYFNISDTSPSALKPFQHTGALMTTAIREGPPRANALSKQAEKVLCGTNPPHSLVMFLYRSIAG